VWCDSKRVETLVKAFNTVLFHYLHEGLKQCATVEEKRRWIDSCERDAKRFYSSLAEHIFGKKKAAPCGAA